ncbi:hypothetical protein BBJ28_00022698 [Nothophytophthora sp. Chile5]|nr:hypothetical protein BBJ28_00022698 [Nothophytophthora sp. Chile5]
MEMEIDYEKKKMKTNGHAAPGGPGDEGKPTKKRSGPAVTNGKTLASKKGSLQPMVTPIKRSAKLKKVGVSPPSKMICVLCRMQQKPDGPEYPKHPFVLKVTALISQQANGSNGLVSKATTTTTKSKQKKRQRRNPQIEGSIPGEEGLVSAEMASSTSDMTPLDYAATYFKFLISREQEKFKDDMEESEDACFCCKDGGEVVECDWKGMSNTFARCPKVYHEGEQLGSHPCFAGCVSLTHWLLQLQIAWATLCQRVRRGCVPATAAKTAGPSDYIRDHMPKDIKKLGLATRDIADSTYIVCAACDKLALEAVEEKKLGADDYAELFRRRVRGGQH